MSFKTDSNGSCFSAHRARILEKIVGIAVGIDGFDHIKYGA
jgi:hypothetical protein